MINNIARICAAAALFGAVAPLVAQDGPPPEFVEALTEVARDTLPMARLSDGSNVPEETAEERAKPLVARSLEVQTIERGLLSVTMDVCGLDFAQLSYLPYMQAMRSSGRYSERQIAYVGVLHGVTMGALESSIPTSICTPEFNEDLEREATSAPIATP